MSEEKKESPALPLQGVTLEFDDGQNVHRFVFPNGARVRATMGEVILWEILQKTEGLTSSLDFNTEALQNLEMRMR